MLAKSSVNNLSTKLNSKIQINEEMLSKMTVEAQKAILHSIFGPDDNKVKILLDTLSLNYSECEFEVRVTDEFNQYGYHTSAQYWDIIPQSELVFQAYSDDIVVTYATSINIPDIKFRQTYSYDDWNSKSSSRFSFVHPFEKKTRITSYKSPFDNTTLKKKQTQKDVTPIAVKLATEEVISEVNTDNFTIDNYERRQRCSYRFANPELAHWRLDKTVRFITKDPNDKRLFTKLDKENAINPVVYDCLDFEIEYVGLTDELIQDSNSITRMSKQGKMYDVIYSFFKLVEVLNPNIISFNIDYFIIQSILQFDPMKLLTKNDILCWNTMIKNNSSDYVVRYELEKYDKVVVFIINDSIYILSRDFHCKACDVGTYDSRMDNKSSVTSTFKKLYEPIKCFDTNSLAKLMLKFQYIYCTKSFYMTVLECCKIGDDYLVDDVFMIKSNCLNQVPYLNRLNLASDYVNNSTNKYVVEHMFMMPTINVVDHTSASKYVDHTSADIHASDDVDHTVGKYVDHTSADIHASDDAVTTTSLTSFDDIDGKEWLDILSFSKHKQLQYQITKHVNTSVIHVSTSTAKLFDTNIVCGDDMSDSSSEHDDSTRTLSRTIAINVNGIRCKHNNSTMLDSPNLIYRQLSRNFLNVRISYNLKYNNFEIFVIRDEEFDTSKVKTAIRNSDFYEPDRRFIKFASLYQEINTLNLTDNWITSDFSQSEVDQISELIKQMRLRREEYTNKYITIRYASNQWVPYELIDISQPNMSKYLSTFEDAKLCAMLIFNYEDRDKTISQLMSNKGDIRSLTINGQYKDIYTSTYNLIDQYITELFVYNDVHDTILNIIDKNINNSNIIFSLGEYYNAYIVGDSSSSLIDYIKFSNFEYVAPKFKTALKTDLKAKIRALNHELDYDDKFMLSLVRHFDNISHSADCIYVQDCNSLCSIDNILKFISMCKYVLSPNGKILLKYIDENMLKDIIVDNEKCNNESSNPFTNINVVSNASLISMATGSSDNILVKIANELIGFCDVFGVKSVDVDVGFEFTQVEGDNYIPTFKCMNGVNSEMLVTTSDKVGEHVWQYDYIIIVGEHVGEHDVSQYGEHTCGQYGDRFAIRASHEHAGDRNEFTRMDATRICETQPKAAMNYGLSMYVKNSAYESRQSDLKVMIQMVQQYVLNGIAVFHRFIIPNTGCDKMVVTKLLNNRVFTLFNEDFIITNICQPITRKEVLKNITTNTKYAQIENVEKFFRALSVIEFQYK